MILPEGVEYRGKSLRISFTYKGQRCRETLKGWSNTPTNIKKAGRLRAIIIEEISGGIFDYLERFPNSKMAQRLGHYSGKNKTLNEFIEEWLKVKTVDHTPETTQRLRSMLKTCSMILDGNRLISNITYSDAMKLRFELLNGQSFTRTKGNITGRMASTVNKYLITCLDLFRYALNVGAIKSNPFNGVKHLTIDKQDPAPLEVQEFQRLVSHPFIDEQTKNLWTIAVYTGLRHGELCALAWEDIDLMNKQITVKRSLTAQNRFKVPKTRAGERTIALLSPAFDALCKQKAITFMYPPVEIDVSSRQKRKSTIQPCTWVFRTGLGRNNRNNTYGYYGPAGLGKLWRRCMQITGITYRNPYQTRHTYACWLLNNGANPAFIAAQMGHSNMLMVMSVYAAWMPSNNKSEIEKIEQQMIGMTQSTSQNL
ncbi:Arm DNA-binding domain-containing protein [Photobacterium damselae]|uniref:Arm DNA-binding domain-containing protein n=1 Tax=Photobacterium damselae TaxID=38293 RepID=UPI0035A81BE8